MLQFTNQTMRLTSVNVRRELAGKDPSAGRTASDLQLVVKGGNDILDKLSPHLRGSFYEADVDKQGALLPHALTKRQHPLLKADQLLYDLKLAGYRVTIDHAGNPESAIVLEPNQQFPPESAGGRDGGNRHARAVPPEPGAARPARRQAAAGGNGFDGGAEDAEAGGSEAAGFGGRRDVNDPASREREPEHDYEDDLDIEDSPYCECDLEPIEEELVGMTCFCCGKEICP